MPRLSEVSDSWRSSMPLRRHPVALSDDRSQLEAIPLDHELIRRLKEAYRLLRASDLQFAQQFYAKVFQARPALRSLFPADLTQQAQKLVAALDAVVDNLERPAENARLLAELGSRHAGYGVLPEHYDLVVGLLIESMREVLGTNASSEILDEWHTVLRLASRKMIAAAHQKS
jgi:hemoglobin-like flavoprotein